MKSYCMALYGAVLWDIIDPKVNASCSSWRRWVRKLIKVNARTHSNLLYLVVDQFMELLCSLLPLSNFYSTLHDKIMEFVQT